MGNGSHRGSGRGSMLDWLRVLLALRVRATYLEVSERAEGDYQATLRRVKSLAECGLAKRAGVSRRGRLNKPVREWVLTREGRLLADTIEALPVMREHVLPPGAVA